MQPSTVPLLRGKSRAALLGCSLGLGNGEWDPHPKRFFSCTGDCGPPPRMAHSKPSVAEQPSSFPVGSRVTYTCLEGAIKIPGRADMVQCLPGSRWSQLPEPCGLSCSTPTRLHFAALSEVDERINFFPIGFTVSYVCHPGYENISESSPTSTCLENLTWSEVCPPRPIRNGQHDGHGKTFFTTGMSVMYSCDPGYYLVGNAQVVCKTLGNWSQPMPRCEGPSCGEGGDGELSVFFFFFFLVFTPFAHHFCTSPFPATICIKPDVLNGQVVDGEGLIYGPGQTVTIQCQDGYSLQGTATILCQEDGSWEPPAPLCDLLHHQMLPIRTRAFR
uniref:Sushi domain-containing protein n=1 Tax=Anas platyrhynchos TaxID=8839 RepID=A0A8B9ZGI0_ANAPL